MYHIAEFEKVSFDQFRLGAEICNVPLSGEALRGAYSRITLPARATEGSAGYDFYSPFDFTLSTRETIMIPSGIRVKIEPGWWLSLLPRSSHGFQFRIQLDNTIGVIDSDYYHADNEGHILVKLSNDSLMGTQMKLVEGDKFVQGIFLPYGMTKTDRADGVRSGGFGSTG